MFLIRLLLMLSFLGIIFPASAQTFPIFEGKPLLDAAHIFNPAQATELNDKLNTIAKISGHQPMVLTIDTIGEYTIEEYANRAGRHYNIGSAAGGDGLLLVFAIGDRKMRIETARGISPILTDALASQVLRDIKPQFKSKDYVGGINSAVDQVGKIITPLTPQQIELNARKAARQRELDRENTDKFLSVLGYVFSVIALTLFGWGGYFLATAKRRKEKEEAERARIFEEEQRRAEQRQKYREDQARQRVARELEGTRQQNDLADRKNPLEAQFQYHQDRVLRKHVPAQAKPASKPAPAPRAKKPQYNDTPSYIPVPTPPPSPSPSYYSPSPSPAPSSSSFDTGGGSSFDGGGSSDSW